ncbi:MAG: hypothetical protein ABIK65_05550 [Candidatus Eisenbacteria bacterium]
MNKALSSGHVPWVLYGIVLALVSAAAFGGAVDQDWSFDDEDYIAAAQRARHDLWYVFSPDKPVQATNARGASRPAVHLYYLALYGLFDGAPSGYHVMSVVLHTLVAFLLALSIASMGGGRIGSFSAGLLFLINLSHLRAVFWAAAVAFLLAALFGLAAFLAMSRTAGAKSKKRSWMASVLFLAAVCAHESAIAFLFPILYLLRHRPRKEMAIAAGPFLVAVGAVLVLSLFVYDTPITMQGGERTEEVAEISQGEVHVGPHILTNMALYVSDIVVGVARDVRWVRWTVPTRVALGCLFLGLLIYSTVRRPRLRIAAAWIVVATLPFAPWDSGTLAWRYHYLPATGVCAVLGLLLSRGGRYGARIFRWGPLAWMIPTSLVALSFFVSLPLIKYTQAVQHSYSGQYLRRQGEYGRAKTQYDFAISKGGDHPTTFLFQYGSALCLLGLSETGRAHSAFRDLVRDHPTYAPAIQWFLRVHGRRAGWPGALLDPSGRITNKRALEEYLHRDIRSAAMEKRWMDASALCIGFLSLFPETPEIRQVLVTSNRNLGDNPSGEDMETPR